MKEEEKTVWIIRFPDKQHPMSFNGTRREAVEFAEKKKELYGGSYIIA